MSDPLQALFTGFVNSAATAIDGAITGPNENASPSAPNPTPVGVGAVDGGITIPPGSGAATAVSQPFMSQYGLYIGLGAVALLLVVLVAKR